MSIQSNINQGLAIGAALLSQTPRAAEVKEKKAAMKELKGITKQSQATQESFKQATQNLYKDYGEIDENNPSPSQEPQLNEEGLKKFKELRKDVYGTMEGLQSRAYELYTKQGQAAPSSLEKILRIRETLNNTNIEKIRRTLANERARSKAQSKASQKQEMNSYIKGVSSDYMKLLKEENNGNNKTSK